jgi:hypothetical protein
VQLKVNISLFQTGLECGLVIHESRIGLVPLVLGPFLSSSIVLAKSIPGRGGKVSPSSFSENSCVSTFLLLRHKAIEVCSDGQ